MFLYKNIQVFQPINKVNAYTAEEFIAAITQHIPEKSFQMVRYYGWYSNKSWGMRLKKGMVRPGDGPLEECIKKISVGSSVGPGLLS